MSLSKLMPKEPIQQESIIVTKTVQCTNCDFLFTELEFQEHVCDYDDDKNFLGDLFTESFEAKVIRLYKQNGEQMVSFLRDQFKINVDKKRHIGPFDCNMCDRTFVYYAGFQRHLEKHRNEVNNATSDVVQSCQLTVKCLKCGQVFANVENGQKHYALHHNLELKMQCDRFKLIVASVVLQCEYCDSYFTKTGDLFHHMSLHDVRSGYKCNNCDISVKTAKEIVHHWQNECVFMEFEPDCKINVLRCFACNVCEDMFTRLEDLLNHRETTLHFLPRLNQKTNQLEIGCEKCEFYATTTQLYVEHHYAVHNCKTTNSKKQSVTSTKPRLHLCEVCGKSYTQSSHLWQHLRFHQGVKPFECPVENCNRKFTIRPDLNDHIRKCHTGERPYHCLLCGKRFLTGSVFYQHRLIHRGERRYGCEDCGKRFYRADALKNHQRIHSGEKPYPCPYCSKAFRQRGDRDKHIRARHKFLPPKNIATVYNSPAKHVTHHQASFELPSEFKFNTNSAPGALPGFETLLPHTRFMSGMYDSASCMDVSATQTNF